MIHAHTFRTHTPTTHTHTTCRRKGVLEPLRAHIVRTIIAAKYCSTQSFCSQNTLCAHVMRDETLRNRRRLLATKRHLAYTNCSKKILDTLMVSTTCNRTLGTQKDSWRTKRLLAHTWRATIAHIY